MEVNKEHKWEKKSQKYSKKKKTERIILQRTWGANQICIFKNHKSLENKKKKKNLILP